MGIVVSQKGKKYDWYKVASAGAEAATQSVILGKLSLGNPMPAFFRLVESMRGDDPVESRAMKLVTETLSYALAIIFSDRSLKSQPTKPQVEELIKGYIERYFIITEQNDIVLNKNDIETPSNFSIFKDAESRIYQDVRDFKPIDNKEDVEAKFRDALSLGISRIMARDPNYFMPVINALNGPGNVADARANAWSEYKSCLIKRFEDAELFAQDSADSPTLGQVYQPLRSWWENKCEDKIVRKSKIDKDDRTIHVGMLEEEVTEWLDKDDKNDRIRLISGGPGSGKSSFAKKLAATMALKQSWRVLFIPLQRLSGTGDLGSRIDEYFRSHRSEPFEADTLPLPGIGRDGYKNWLIIFDGLDEIAKEGMGSEKAAQEFSSALIDWKARIGEVAKLRFVVLGRAPSMQEARNRLSLHGDRTLHVADMLPIKEKYYAKKDVKIVDIHNVSEIDQREEFWSRWATANREPTEMPEGMIAKELRDLTKEPLLAYLLIISGYVSSRWKEAAENRNRVYRAIFDRIWERERFKEARQNINDMGKESFDALMQALGIAAWRGGGRTGDEKTFIEIRDVFMRPDLLAKAKSCGSAELDNVALLFYTRKDEEQNRGYEFLHKSFGEYLTACGLLDAFHRWGSQVMEPSSDFNHRNFFNKWIGLASSSPITEEISEFLKNEVRLYESSNENDKVNCNLILKWVETAVSLVSHAMENGFPISDRYESSVNFDSVRLNAETCLWAVLNACACAAYPMKLFGKSIDQGGWLPGPITIPAILRNNYALDDLLRRCTTSPVQHYQIGEGIISELSIRSMIINRFLSRIRADNSVFSCHSLMSANLEGSSLKNCDFNYVHLISMFYSGADFSGSKFLFSSIGFPKGGDLMMSRCEFIGTNIYRIDAVDIDFQEAKFDNCIVRNVDARYMKMGNATSNNMKMQIFSADQLDLTGAVLRNTSIAKRGIKKMFSAGLSVDKKSTFLFNNDGDE